MHTACTVQCCCIIKTKEQNKFFTQHIKQIHFSAVIKRLQQPELMSSCQQCGNINTTMTV